MSPLRRKIAQRLVAEAHREEGLIPREQLVDGTAERRDLGVVAVAWIAGARAEGLYPVSAVTGSQPSGLVTSIAARGSRRRFAVLARPSVIDT